jgi:hypothetical protein
MRITNTILLILTICLASCAGLNLESANKALSVVEKVSFEGDSLALTTSDIEINFEFSDLSKYGEIANVIDTNGVQFSVFRSSSYSTYEIMIMIPSRKVKIPLRIVD